jgi:antibiotic biosynthesis monooxygenase (ABM) superfamily enzyme
MSTANTYQENPLATQQISCASLVIEHRVPQHKEPEFRQWQESLNEAVDQFTGYLRTDLSPPVTGAQEKWYVIVYFDTPENLNQWVNSAERKTLVRKGEDLFGSYKFRSFKTGLESWFSTESETPEANIPPWKQNLIVLLGLYPTVMVQTLLISSFDLMKGWPLSVAMFINNLVCCSLLTWVVIPPLSNWFHDWLTGNSEHFSLKKLKGLSLILGSLIILVLLFYTTSDNDPMTVYRTLQKIPRQLFS